MNCLETKGLAYKFGAGAQVLKGIDIQVPQGSLYGFLGPNGAGKTTTLRLLLGLLKMQEGEINIFNQSFKSNRIGILKKIGSLIESPSIYGHLTAAENLQIWQQLYQCSPKRIPEVLDEVGLAGTGKKKAGHFSLGMKQRLTIAIAILQNPSLLILDEPTNGLDPNGIIDMRELFKTLNKDHGMTIIISSHLLAEIEKMVTHVGIIHNGRMLFQGTLQELQYRQTFNATIFFETGDAGKTQQLFIANGLACTSHNGKLTIPFMEKEKVASLVKQLVNAGIAVYQVGQLQDDLESIFIDLVKD